MIAYLKMWAELKTGTRAAVATEYVPVAALATGVLVRDVTAVGSNLGTSLTAVASDV